MAARTASVVFIEPLLGELKRQMFEDAAWGVELHRFWGDIDGSIAQIAKDAPDLIVLDYFAGREANARGLIARLQAHATLRSVPLIVCHFPEQPVTDLRETLSASTATIIARPYSVEGFMHEVDLLIRRADGVVRR